MVLLLILVRISAFLCGQSAGCRTHRSFDQSFHHSSCDLSRSPPSAADWIVVPDTQSRCAALPSCCSSSWCRCCWQPCFWEPKSRVRDAGFRLPASRFSHRNLSNRPLWSLLPGYLRKIPGGRKFRATCLPSSCSASSVRC